MEIQKRNEVGEALRTIMDEHSVLMFNIAAQVRGFTNVFDIIDDMESSFKKFKKSIRGDYYIN